MSSGLVASRGVRTSPLPLQGLKRMTGSELFEVKVETRVLALHGIGPSGESVAEHEHPWNVAVHVRSTRLDTIAIVVDFRRLLQDTDSILDEIRGLRIESHPRFASHPATAANVARWILERLQHDYEGEPFSVVAVDVEADPGIIYTARCSEAAR